MKNEYPVFLVRTAGSNDYMAEGKLLIAAKSRQSVGLHIDRSYGPITSIERVNLTSSRLGYLFTVL